MIDVSKLSKVELNRAMIWCYPDCIYGRSKGTIYSRYSSFIGFVDVGFLDVWNLTMPLAVENNLKIHFHTKEASAIDNYPYAKNKNPLRPICEVLVMIALEKKHG